MLERDREKPTDLYAVLGVQPGATQDQIAAAFYALAQQLHPDTAASADDCGAAFKVARTAYEILSDPAARRRYDMSRRHGRASPIGSTDARRSRSHTRSPNTTDAGEGRTSSRVFDLPISVEEARFGGPCEVAVRRSTACTECSGRSDCQLCRGSGRTRQTETVRFRLPMGLRDGMHIDLPQSDICLRVRIRPSW